MRAESLQPNVRGRSIPAWVGAWARALRSDWATQLVTALVAFEFVYLIWTVWHFGGGPMVVSDVAPIPVGLASAILAWRAWRVTRRRGLLVLESVYHRVHWPFRQRLVAHCMGANGSRRWRQENPHTSPAPLYRENGTGRLVNSCLVLGVEIQGRAVTTIEGLTGAGGLHPVQRAFIDHDAVQCGFCTPGQVMAAVALLEADPAPDESAIRRHMSGNLCRCGTYPRIAAAIRSMGAARGTDGR